MVSPELRLVRHLSPPPKELVLRLQLLSVAYRLALASQILSTVRDPVALPLSADPSLPDPMPAVEGLALVERLPT
jgi:hypothetical protein